MSKLSEAKAAYDAAKKASDMAWQAHSDAKMAQHEAGATYHEAMEEASGKKVGDVINTDFAGELKIASFYIHHKSGKLIAICAPKLKDGKTFAKRATLRVELAVPE